MVKTRSSETYVNDNRFDLCRHSRNRNVDLICSDQNDTNESEEDEPIKHRTRSQDRKVTIQVDREDYSPGRSSPRRRTRKPMRFRDSDEEPIDAAYTSQSRREMHRRQLKSSISSPCSHSHGYEPRRSSRTRKLMYDTFNTSLMAMMSHTDNEDDGGLSHLENLRGEENHKEPVIQRKKRKTIEVEPMPEEEMTNMYERVKRPRRQVKRDMYGRPLEEVEEKTAESTEDAESEESESSESSEESSSEEEEQHKGYSLRENKPRTQMLEINWKPDRPRRNRTFNVFHESTPPPRRKSTTDKVYHKSPARKHKSFRRRRAAFHGSSSTSSSNSSGGDSGDDERRFERRKAKSMAKSRQRCLPMNFVPEDLSSGILKDRTRIGSSLADIDPMNVDRSVTFDSVGGLGKHIRALKEMIVFPLLYPEVFERFKIQPPRGVLFYGPPGTGKTLVARALANECSRGEKKVAFFMRKGADCLSKWVGESERQLRLLFDQAYQMRPSIVFFDEIDGLAPVRSSRQDQIHSSIVSTLLALMDGLDNRGEIVVIGATNRIDSIDPALRRPGRFDREFLFPLPSVQARRQILEIHTKQWEPKLCSEFLAELAEKCVGYCGADLKSLCTEAALHALRRRYPQIYLSDDKLQLDVTSINVNGRDFHHGMKSIVPASQRSITSPARALLHSVSPLLIAQLNTTLSVLNRMFPKAVTDLTSLDNHEEFATDSEEEGPEIFENPVKGRSKRRSNQQAEQWGPFLDFSRQAVNTPSTHRPRMLLAGYEGQGQSSHLGPALLHNLERMPVHVLDLPALFAVSAKTPEESCSQIFREAKRSCPSVVYIPHICQWWDVITDTCRATFLSLLQDVESLSPLLLLATSDVPYLDLPAQVQELFSINSGEVMLMQNPTDSERYQYFEDLLLKQACKPPSTNRKAAQHALESLPKAPRQEPRQLTSEESRRLREQEEVTMRELRLFLRDVLNKLARDRKFAIFSKPVDGEEVPDYYDVIEHPMDMSTMMSKIDLKKYECVAEFMKDIHLICSNALEYNPDKDPQGRIIRHRACAFKDTAEAIITTELDADFEKLCKEIKQSRKNRGVRSEKDVPDYYFTKPITHTALNALQLDPQGLQIDSTGQQHSARSSRYLHTVTQDKPTQEVLEPIYEEINGKRYKKVIRRKIIPKKSFDRHKQSPFCRSSKRKMRNVVIYIDDGGAEFTKSDLLGNQLNTNKEKLEDEKEEIGTEKQPSENADDTKPVAVTETLTIETGNMEEIDAEKENNPHCAHSPKIRTGSRRTRSFSPKGGDGHTLSPQRSPRTRSPRSPRTMSPRSNSPRVHSPNIHNSSRSQSSRQSASHTHGVKFVENEKEKLLVTAELTKDEEMQSVRKSNINQSLSETQEANSADQVRFNSAVSTNRAVTKSITMNTSHMTGACNVMQRSPGSPRVGSSPKKCSPSKKASPGQRKEEDMEEGEGVNSSPLAPPRTRSQTSNRQMHHAMEIIEKQIPSVHVDIDRLKCILDKTVEGTRGYNVEKLERLYSVLSQHIYHHRQEYDKTQLLGELEATVERL